MTTHYQILIETDILIRKNSSKCHLTSFLVFFQSENVNESLKSRHLVLSNCGSIFKKIRPIVYCKTEMIYPCTWFLQHANIRKQFSHWVNINLKSDRLKKGRSGFWRQYTFMFLLNKKHCSLHVQNVLEIEFHRSFC